MTEEAARTMSLLDLVRRSPPEPWRDGDNIPWHEPEFSQRMLKEHLSQLHDLASRRFVTIDQHVAWIDSHVLQGAPTKILDLGCGPGLYCSRLALRGHNAVGIDYSPASIDYAVDYAKSEQLRCQYVLDDIRRVDYGTGFGLVMLLFGELSVFRLSDARAILRKANDALTAGGMLLLESHTDAAIRGIGAEPLRWDALQRGLFSDRPHLYLQEYSWDEESAAATIRYFIVDAQSAAVSRYAQSFQAYTDAEYHELLTECGFIGIEQYATLAGPDGEADEALVVYVARKPAA